MRYTYAYKTSDGTRHEESMDAESREAVFAALRERGIKAIKVVAADGSKANGEVRGRKRIAALAVLGALCLVLSVVVVVVFWGGRGATPGHPATRVARPLPRQAVAGDRGRVEAAVAKGFGNRTEAFLARFAEPGRPVVAATESDWPTKAEVEAALAAPIRIAGDEFTESIDVKRIVAGMKEEMAAYLSAGGYASGYFRELQARQARERGFRDSAEKHLRALLAQRGVVPKAPDQVAARTAERQKEAYDYWLKANAQLQSMGIYPLVLPDELREYQMSVGLDEEL